jgi:alkenylglycerophosphocholine/alkenylglycerophosphoethanolamine hydrolase
VTGATVVLVGIALIVAAVDWHAVANGETRWRPVTKTVPMVLLIAAALVEVGSDSERHSAAVAWLAVAAAVLSLLGDILLLPQVDAFVGGLASFLLAHIAYIAAFLAVGVDVPVLALAAVGILVVLSPLAVRIIRSVRATEPPLVPPVIVYIAVISAMAACAIATRSVVPAVGALVFVASDAQLAWNRFVSPKRILDVGCIVTYHVAQGLLVLSLV